MELSTRPVGPEDAKFLAALYASTREAEMALLPWNAERKSSFLAMQLDVQQRSYATRFPSACFHLIEERGRPVGRITVDIGELEICLVEIALIPAARGRGIGTALLHDLLRKGHHLHLPVTLHVEPDSPAKRLYERLGFERFGGDDLRDYMRAECRTVT